MKKTANRQQTYYFEVLDRYDMKLYRYEVKANNWKEAENKCSDFYCFMLSCNEEAISIRNVSPGAINL